MAVEKDDVIALVPAGYEELGKAHVDDLIVCRPILENFLDLPFHSEKIVLKIYIGNDDKNRGFATKGHIFYKRSRANIDFDLQGVINDSPDGILSMAKPNSCGNTHELTHAFMYETPLPGWAREGLSEYSQKINQLNSKENISCYENGLKRPDIWNSERSDITFFAFEDLSEDRGPEPFQGPVWYHTAMCLIEEIDETYGRQALHSIIQRAVTYRTNPEIWKNAGGDTDYIFVNLILAEELGDGIYELLEKYGFEENDYQPWD